MVAAVILVVALIGGLFLIPILTNRLRDQGDSEKSGGLKGIAEDVLGIHDMVLDSMVVKPIQGIVTLAEGSLNDVTAKTVFIPPEGTGVQYKVKGQIDTTRDKCSISWPANNDSVHIADQVLGNGEYAIVKMIANHNGQFAWKCENTPEVFRFNRSDAGEEMAICAEWNDGEVAFSSWRYAVGHKNAKGKGHCPQDTRDANELGRLCAASQDCLDKYALHGGVVEEESEVDADRVDTVLPSVYAYDLLRMR